MMTRCCLVVVCFTFSLAPLHGQTPEARQATIKYVQSLQTKDGGFLAVAPDPATGRKDIPTLRATSSAIRALKYLGGKIPDKQACMKFVAGCFDKASGGFKDSPFLGKPDVFTTAVGIMAVAELGMPTEPYADAVVKYLSENAKTFDDIRIAVAGLERIKKRSPRTDAWLEQAGKLWNRDGLAGKGDGVARETGSLAVTWLRLGGKLKNSAEILKALKAGQRNNGGFGKEGSAVSDLETTYRVMRAFVMLNDRPEDVENLRTFVAKCRNEDHGYGVSPNERSTVSATYFAAIILYWLDEKK